MGSSPLTRGKHQGGRRRRRRMGLIPAHAGKTRLWGGVRLWPRAHPRSRGENFLLRRLVAARRGSSPLTRGKRAGMEPCSNGSGLIPAHAGKTGVRRRGDRGHRAHPRSRGENVQGSEPFPPSAGSSPLTRGKRFGVSVTVRASRLIPAHAGKTRPRTHRRSPRRAHPRSRGENFTLAIHQRDAEGLIPAHAGKTRAMRIDTVPSRAHPRSRGENTS